MLPKYYILTAYYVFERKKANQPSYPSRCRFHKFGLIWEYDNKCLRLNIFDKSLLKFSFKFLQHYIFYIMPFELVLH
jgi:hypothetical protein